jgi:hypothetical protein
MMPASNRKGTTSPVLYIFSEGDMLKGLGAPQRLRDGDFSWFSYSMAVGLEKWRKSCRIQTAGGAFAIEYGGARSECSF